MSVSIRTTAATAVVALAASALSLSAAGSPAQASVRVFPVPTQGAGLGHIVTAPNGTMWFAETEDGIDQVGRITPSGQITEFPMPDLDPTGDSYDAYEVLDVATAPDSSVWVIFNGGRDVLHLDTNGNQIGAPVATNLDYDGTDWPFADSLVVTPDGTPWVTMGGPTDGLSRIAGGQDLWSANAPQCDNFLDGPTKIAVGSDGAVWCQGGQNVIRSNADATGGVTCPLPSDATYPSGLAAGPSGALWITRRDPGSYAFYPDSGSIGVIDDNCGYDGISLGSRSAPAGPVLGPDHKVWFVNQGGAPGIGHVSASGRGAIHSVGNYHPTSLTFAHDGSIWFTDADANSIVRVLPGDLQGTNVDLGDGSQLVPDTVGAGQVIGAKKTVRVRAGKVPLRLACPKSVGACTGTVRLTTAQHAKAVAKPKKYAVKRGGHATVKVKLSAKGKHLVRHGRVTRLKVRLYLHGGKKPAASVVIRVKR